MKWKTLAPLVPPTHDKLGCTTGRVLISIPGKQAPQSNRKNGASLCGVVQC